MRDRYEYHKHRYEYHKRKIEVYGKELDGSLNRLASTIAESGTRAARESNVDATWFQSWAKKELPDLLAQCRLRLLSLFEELTQRIS